MSKQPDDRFESAREVAHLLEECLAHVQQPTAVPLPASLVTPPAGGLFYPVSRRSLGAIAMITAVGLSLLGVVLWQTSAAPDSAGKRADEERSEIVRESGAPPAASQPKREPVTPQRLHHFMDLTTGNDVKIAYSADGRLIAIANANPTRIMMGGGRSRVANNWKPEVDILDAETGKTVASLELITAEDDALLAATARISHAETTSLAFSPEGSVVAVGTSIGQVKLFNSQTGKLIRSLDDEAAKLADEETPEHWDSLPRAMGSVASLAFSPDGSLLAICGGSFADVSERFDRFSRMGFRSTGPGRLKVWDSKTGMLKYDLAGHNDHANAVAFSPDGRLLASAGRWLKDRDFGNGVILWNPQIGTQIRSFRNTANGGTRSVAFSPDGKLLVIGTQRFEGNSSTGGVSLVRVRSGVVDWLVTVPGWAKSLAFSPDGKSIVVLCGGRSIRFLDAETGNVKHEIQSTAPQGGRWNELAITRHGDRLAVGGVDDAKNGSVEVWDYSDHPDAAANSAPLENGQNPDDDARSR